MFNLVETIFSQNNQINNSNISRRARRSIFGQQSEIETNEIKEVISQNILQIKNLINYGNYQDLKPQNPNNNKNSNVNLDEHLKKNINNNQNISNINTNIN